jgi:hypothetical protein
MAQISPVLYNTIAQAYASIENSFSSVDLQARVAVDAIVDVTTFTYPDDTPSLADAEAALEIESILLSPFNLGYAGAQNISVSMSSITTAVRSLNNFVIRNSSFSGTSKEKLDNWINIEMLNYWTTVACPSDWAVLCSTTGYNTDDWILGDDIRANLEDNTVAQYKMNDTSGSTVVDSQGTQNGELYDSVIPKDLSVVSTSHTSPLTNMNRYFDLATTGDLYNIKIDDNSSFSPTDGAGNDEPFSISCWVNHIDPTSGIQTYLSKYDITNGKYEWFFYISNGTINYRMYESPVNTVNIGMSSVSNTLLTAGQWHYLTATYDGSKTPSGFVLYIDGSPVSTVEINNNPPFTGMSDTEADVYISAYMAAGTTLSGFMGGSIDNVCIFNKELSQTEVSFLYNSGEGTELLKNF